MTSLLDLPDDALANIFLHLDDYVSIDNMTRSCKRLCHVRRSYRILTRFKFNKYEARDRYRVLKGMGHYKSEVDAEMEKYLDAEESDLQEMRDIVMAELAKSGVEARTGVACRRCHKLFRLPFDAYAGAHLCEAVMHTHTGSYQYMTCEITEDVMIYAAGVRLPGMYTPRTCVLGDRNMLTHEKYPVYYPQSLHDFQYNYQAEDRHWILTEEEVEDKRRESQPSHKT
jgi:hypothetical protein